MHELKATVVTTCTRSNELKIPAWKQGEDPDILTEELVAVDSC